MAAQLNAVGEEQGSNFGGPPLQVFRGPTEMDSRMRQQHKEVTRGETVTPAKTVS